MMIVGIRAKKLSIRPLKENISKMSLIRRIRPEKTGVKAPLGELELNIMRHVWDSGREGCLGAEVLEALESKRSIAVSTVLTTLDRLWDKGIVTREREGKAYRYWALLSEEELEQRIVQGIMGELISQFPKAVAAYFAQAGIEGDKAINEKTLGDLAERLESISDKEQDGD